MRRVDCQTNALPTDQPTDQPTDTASYRGALSHLKTSRDRESKKMSIKRYRRNFQIENFISSPTAGRHIYLKCLIGGLGGPSYQFAKKDVSQNQPSVELLTKSIMFHKEIKLIMVLLFLIVLHVKLGRRRPRGQSRLPKGLRLPLFISAKSLCLTRPHDGSVRSILRVRFCRFCIMHLSPNYTEKQRNRNLA